MRSVSLQSRVNPFCHVIADIQREPLDISVALDILKPECPLMPPPKTAYGLVTAPLVYKQTCHKNPPLRNLFMLIMSSIEMLIHGDESSRAAHESKKYVIMIYG